MTRNFYIHPQRMNQFDLEMASIQTLCSIGDQSPESMLALCRVLLNEHEENNVVY